jgi:hypothetical protein
MTLALTLDPYIDRIFYDSLGYTGNTYYCRFVFNSDGTIWDADAAALAVSPTWENSAVPLVEQGGNTGQYALIIPTALPVGKYDVIIYLQAGSDPANTDDVALQYATIKGSIFKF